MKRWKKVVGGVLVVLAAAGAGAAWHFQNELQTVRYHLCYSMMTSEREKKFSSHLCSRVYIRLYDVINGVCVRRCES